MNGLWIVRGCYFSRAHFIIIHMWQNSLEIDQSRFKILQNHLCKCWFNYCGQMNCEIPSNQRWHKYHKCLFQFVKGEWGDIQWKHKKNGSIKNPIYNKLKNMGYVKTHMWYKNVIGNTWKEIFYFILSNITSIVTPTSSPNYII
jgi:hypothetical protein